MIEQVFNPAFGSTSVVTNSLTETAAIELPGNCREVLLTNTSATARVHVYVTYQGDANFPVGTPPTLTNGLPILPAQQVRISVGMGRKVIRTIATAADATIILTPGNGG